MWPKDIWKRIPHLIQQHETPRKGHSTINLHARVDQIEKVIVKKIKWANTPTD